MKSRLNIFIPLLALLILLAAQVYLVIKMYSLYNREFNRNYGDMVYFGTESLEQQSGLNIFNQAFSEMDFFSSHLVFDYPGVGLESDTIKSAIISVFDSLLYKNDVLTPFLKDYLGNNKIDSDISTLFIVRSLRLKNFDLEYSILDKTSQDEPVKLKPGFIFVRSFIARYDYFDIEFDFYVDFSNKIKIIAREMSTILLVIILTLVVVLFVYARTLRNLMKQKKLSDLKSDFISNMTHELKTPLSTIAVASSSLTLDNVLSDKGKTKNLSEIIKRQNRLLNQMIDQVLDVSALEKSGFALKIENTQIRNFINEIVEDFSVETEKRADIKIKFEMDEKFSAMIDRFQITRVFNNLFSNSIKYCEKEPEIKILVSADSDNLIFKIEDNGIGIPKEDGNEVFNKFYRCNNNSSGKIKGLGLGLYFVKRIVEAHGGIVALESTVGEGSTFIINLPIKTELDENITG